MTSATGSTVCEIETIHGHFLDYVNPTPDMIDWEDIAQGLSYMPRFVAQTSFFWSVGQHSLLVANIVAGMDGNDEQVLAALLHDAHEAYIGDIPTPLKNVFGPVVHEVTNGIDDAIIAKLDLQPGAFSEPLVKLADAIALRAEAHVVKVSRGNDSRWDRAWAPRLPAAWRSYCVAVEQATSFVAVEQQFLAYFEGLLEATGRS